ncbi:hypothetical protein HCN44_010608 [Aphidius gifuensis]|uniref:RNA helicase n=1 Tax=Aphidius gifuensis TaxID=684658 RepID=A0A834XUE3_APHGI|nr:probable ATP-dependent RNA helicase kurz [Aphidius gifuensis]KAF7991807.1 hypothetical protein HCN44_010608 [Aphidius gifuensis]
MNTVKKKYNWKARSTPKIEIDNSQTKNIVVEFDNPKEHYDNCNALVLPDRKRQTINRDKKKSTVKLLSKKRRKVLEKVLEKKKKKFNRVGLLENLQKVQIPAEELKNYVSLTTIQTKGLKRHLRDEERAESKVENFVDNNGDDDDDDDDDEESAIDAIKGNKRARLSLLNDKSAIKKAALSDPNIVGFEESSDDDSLSSDNDDDNDDEVDEVDDEKEQINSTPSLPSPPPTPPPVVVVKEKIIPIVEIKKEEIPRIPAVFVALDRKPEIQMARLKLPILREEQTIVETINENSVIIITGETGSGKTTQIPQFLYEAGYAKNKLIGITEPRRVAAMSMSKRVAEEMNLPNSQVSYLIRFEGNTTNDTKIKFMTDGVLLKELQNDFYLSKYSVIILDEAHERSVYTDILIGFLSRIVERRTAMNDPLKVIIMSATLRVEDFLDNRRLFKIKPPLITVESRQHNVQIHHNRKTSQNYVLDSLKKIVKIHKNLPEGGILVFLTGQHEVNSVVEKLRKYFPYNENKKLKKQAKNVAVVDEEADNNDDDDDDDEMCIFKKLKRKKKQIQMPNINLDDYSATPTDDTQDDLFDINDSDNEEDEEDEELLMDLENSTAGPLWVLPLYSLLPSNKQAEVFKPVPDGCRLCVVSTNIAETSLTIPNIKYVVDSGRCKKRLYEKITGVSKYEISYISKAAANQRAGRAGRTRDGHCYRLYSSAVFNDQFELYSEPEICRKPVDDLLLQMKVMNISKVINFPFPSSPDIVQLKTAEKKLCLLGALELPIAHKRENYNSKVTQLGKSISVFPVTPRYGKMLSISHQYNLIGYTICMVSALSVQELLIEGLGIDGKSKIKWLKTRRMWAGNGNSLLLGDPMVLIKAIGAAEYEYQKGKIDNFCTRHGLRTKAVVEIRKLRQQLTNDITLNIPNLELIVDPNMLPPNDEQSLLLRQIILAGMVDHVAKKIKRDEIKDDQDKDKYKYAYKTIEMEDPVYMHSSCVLKKTLPEWIVYQEVYETNKMYIRGITAIEPEWLPKFVPSLCHLSEPLVDPPPRYDDDTGKIICHMTGTFGRAAWELPPMELEHPSNIDGVKLFAKFLLNGQVFTKLQKFVPILISEGDVMIKPWAKTVPRVDFMAKQLLSQGVMTRDKLIEVWKRDDKFLLSAYQKWIPESAHKQVSKLWPPM